MDSRAAQYCWIWPKHLIKCGIMGLVYKVKVNLPKQMSQLLKSYISECQFRVKCGDDYSNLKNISAGILQGLSLIHI